MKLKESIPSNSVKIIDLYNKINSDILDTSPDFQRKLVWKKQHKYSFIETVLMNFPFPEVYIASSDMDVETLSSKEIVVDGKQRLTAIVDYIKGINDFKGQNKIKSFDKLENDEKRDFLNYLVTVKDLKDMEMTNIKEIFQRINSTEYSLNTMERTNAQFGDGEFAIFCKQIVDSNTTPSINETDIIIDQTIKLKLNDFFTQNSIFTENDKSRMFDVQYIMIIISTFLEGGYYGRSSKVNEYLEKYNSEFNIYEIPLKQLLNSVEIINRLGFSCYSYWFNKANIFTLIIELSKYTLDQLDMQKIEQLLLEFETKVDLYFSDDESIDITEEEKKYFEVARQGSHEKSARILRGKVLSGLLNTCLKTTDTNSSLSKNQSRLNILEKNGVVYTTIQPTKTGLEKSIIDATINTRAFLKNNNFHNYESQKNGIENKIIINAKYVDENELNDFAISLYKANNRGDSRMSFSSLNSFSQPNDLLALICKNDILYLLNISSLKLEELIGKPNLFNDVIIK
jgi:hypothetical protein